MSKSRGESIALAHRRPLLEQWRLQLASFLGLELKDIGQIGAGKDKANGNLDVAMIQSMERRGAVDDRIIDYGFIIADECHHISAVTFERVLMQAKAKYILGLTATPYRKDGHQPIIHMQCGPICYQKKQIEIDQQVSKYIVIPRMTGLKVEWNDDSNIYDLWPKLIGDEERNRLIINDVLRVIEAGRFPIIITERREHLKILSHMLEGKIQNLVILYGGLSMRDRREMIEKLTQLPSIQTRAILATGTYIGEGFDKPQLDTLFITMPISFKGRVVQYAGRLHRKYNGKMDIKIYDYVDADIPVLWRMYEKRLKTYKSMGYANLEEVNL